MAQFPFCPADRSFFVKYVISGTIGVETIVWLFFHWQSWLRVLTRIIIWLLCLMFHSQLFVLLANSTLISLLAFWVVLNVCSWVLSSVVNFCTFTAQKNCSALSWLSTLFCMNQLRAAAQFRGQQPDTMLASDGMYAWVGEPTYLLYCGLNMLVYVPCAYSHSLELKLA